MSATLSHEARKAVGILERLIQTEEISVPLAARHLDKTPQWVRDNLPVIIHSRKSHSVRLVDIEAYQIRRTLRPKGSTMSEKELQEFLRRGQAAQDAVDKAINRKVSETISPDSRIYSPAAKAEGDKSPTLSRSGVGESFTRRRR